MLRLRLKLKLIQCILVYAESVHLFQLDEFPLSPFNDVIYGFIEFQAIWSGLARRKLDFEDEIEFDFDKPTAFTW